LGAPKLEDMDAMDDDSEEILVKIGTCFKQVLAENINQNVTDKYIEAKEFFDNT